MTDTKKLWDLNDPEESRTAEAIYVLTTLQVWADQLDHAISGKKRMKPDQWGRCATDLANAARWIQRRHLDAAKPLVAA